MIDAEIKKGNVKGRAKDVNQEKTEKSKQGSKKKVAKPFNYLKHLMLTEKAIDHITLRNTLVFVVDVKANKSQIKREVESIFDVKVRKVNTLVDRKGRKKAYVSLMPEYKAENIATQLGMM